MQEIWLKMGYVEIKMKSAEVKELLVELCDLYNSSMNVPSSSKSGKCRSGESSQSIVSQTNKSSSKKSIVEATGIIKDMEEEWERELEDSQEAVVVHEVDKYLLDPIENPPSPEKFNILEWWKMNGDK
ncbi:hypothetical protein ACLB2K_061800 [Fragaria x ananassa]